MNNKYDGNNMPYSNSQQQNRMHNNPSQFSVEDDLGTIKNGVVLSDTI